MPYGVQPRFLVAGTEYEVLILVWHGPLVPTEPEVIKKRTEQHTHHGLAPFPVASWLLHHVTKPSAPHSHRTEQPNKVLGPYVVAVRLRNTLAFLHPFQLQFFLLFGSAGSTLSA